MDKQKDTIAVSEDEDPMKFIEESEKYHDWTVVVKDPHTQSEKEFSVVELNLAAHSSVFRKMMTDPKWVKEKRLVIPNMSPETFNLIYRYVNAGELGLQKLSLEDIADLTVAADMYMIPRLVKKGCKRLIPSNIEEVFPPLFVVSFIANTELEPHVAKFVQNNTQEIMMSAKFLLLDGRCIEFIAKQEFLSVSELELWRNLVKWAQHQVADDKTKTLRSVLGGALKYVRFRTLTHEDIVREVAPTSVLGPEELSTLFCAVIGKQPWNQPGLCSSETMRQPKSTNTDKTVASVNPACAVFKTLKSYCSKENYVSYTHEPVSHFTIETKKTIELQSLVFKSKPQNELKPNGEKFYSMNCTISVRKQVKGSYPHFCTMSQVMNDLYCGDDVFTMSAINSSLNQNVKLEANNKYHFTIKMKPALMTFDLTYVDYNWGDRNTRETTGKERKVQDVMTVQFLTPIHVREIHYKILP